MATQRQILEQLRKPVKREDFDFLYRKIERDDHFTASNQDKRDILRMMYFYDCFMYKGGKLPRFLLRHRRHVWLLVAGVFAAGIVATFALDWILRQAY
jgi:hypothetical protein